MAASFGASGTAPYQFRQGGKADSPILLPLAVQRADLPAMTLLCRRICPGAPVLVPDVDRLSEHDPRRGARQDPGQDSGQDPGQDPGQDLSQDGEGALVDRLADAITHAVRRHGLALVPMILIGHATGADLAARLLLAHAPLLSAGILLQPMARITPVRPGTLDGIHVLLARVASETATGTAGQQIYDSLLRAGALLICENVHARTRPGVREAVIGRVFVSTLFGA